jgi:hypothetical protein
LRVEVYAHRRGVPAGCIHRGAWSGRIVAREVAVHELVESRLAQIEALCRALGLRRLDLVGSAAQGTFDVEPSDVDVLAEFAGGADFDYFGTYFAPKRVWSKSWAARWTSSAPRASGTRTSASRSCGLGSCSMPPDRRKYLGDALTAAP